MEIQKIGVAGCGAMGSGIAQLCAQSGYQTIVLETNDELLDKGLELIKASLAKAVKREQITNQDEKVISARIKGTTNIKDFADVDLVIESIIEDMEEKKRLFASLDDICDQRTIFASNTSSLSIIEMASVTRRATHILGMHFMNPPIAMTLVELVRSIVTSEEVLSTTKSFVESLGKTMIISKDRPGFIINSLLIPFLLDATRALESGYATKEDIDIGMELGANHPMGPFKLMDFTGVDVLYRCANGMYNELKDSRYAPPLLLKQMFLTGHHGRKTGKGFYEYK